MTGPFHRRFATLSETRSWTRALAGLALGAGLSAAPAAKAEAPPVLAPATPVPERPALDPGTLIETVMGDPARLREALEGAFHSMLGEPRRLRVELGDGTPAERLRGYFRHIAVHFEDGALDQLQVARATLEATDVHYDLHALLGGEEPLPRMVGETRLVVDITEDAINQILDAKRGSLGIRNPRVRLEDGALHFSGGLRLLFLSSQLDVQGALRVQDGHQVHFRPSRLAVSRIRVPGPVVRSIARRFNPVVDLSRAPWWETFQPRLDVVEVREGVMEVGTRGLVLEGLAEVDPGTDSTGSGAAAEGTTHSVVPFRAF